jgi:peroxiredoxin Q/BCP
MSIKVGDKAPSFVLPGTGGASYTLEHFAGAPLVLVFYPGDNTPVCTKQLNCYNDELAQFTGIGAQVVGISAQGVSSHDEFSQKHGFGFPLLADTDKAVASAYGVVGPLGFPRRSVFVIDAKGVISYVHRALAGITFRPVSELVAAVEQARKA